MTASSVPPPGPGCAVPRRFGAVELRPRDPLLLLHELAQVVLALEALERVSVKTGSGVYVLEHPGLGGSAYQNISPFELT